MNVKRNEGKRLDNTIQDGVFQGKNYVVVIDGWWVIKVDVQP